MWEVLETASYVAENSRHVHIGKKELVAFSREMIRSGIKVPAWDNRYHFFDGGENTVAYLLVLDTLNFCFWPKSGQPRWEIQLESEKISGYYALAAALQKLLESGIAITDAHLLAELSLGEMKQLLGGTGKLQLLRERLEGLNELGRVLLRDYSGQAHRLVEAAERSAVKLSQLLAQNLISFQDIAAYNGQSIFFYKRAQLFAADLYGAFNGTKWGDFSDMHELTAFADYKLPQVLRHLGILYYKKALAQKVDQYVHLDAGSPEEVEIRANTIWAVELIRQELNKAESKLNAFEIDWILWNLGQKEAYKVKPYHRTETIFY